MDAMDFDDEQHREGGLTQQQVEWLQRSWARVVPIAPEAAKLFYARLFELDPGLRSLFRGDAGVQHRALIAALDQAVNALEDPGVLAPVLSELGRRHAGYGVVPAHFDVVGAALIWTLERGLGDAFVVPVREAWEALFAEVRRMMLAGMHARAA